MQQRDDLISDAGTTINALRGKPRRTGRSGICGNRSQLYLRLRDRERKLLKKIEETIESIDHGEYGICEACGCEISIKRLEARAVTTMCIECKTNRKRKKTSRAVTRNILTSKKSRNRAIPIVFTLFLFSAS